MICWNIKEWFCKNVKILLFYLEYSSQLDMFLCCLWRSINHQDIQSLSVANHNLTAMKGIVLTCVCLGLAFRYNVKGILAGWSGDGVHLNVRIWWLPDGTRPLGGSTHTDGHSSGSSLKIKGRSPVFCRRILRYATCLSAGNTWWEMDCVKTF